LAVQKAAGCVVGEDYPTPIVDHPTVSKANMAKMSLAYAAHKQLQGGGGANKSKAADVSSSDGGAKAKRAKTMK
jgi:cryptochrome